VDANLDDEIGEECSKYGTVGHITIFEVTEPGFDPTEAVRIFVQVQPPPPANLTGF
jgi:splicing factor 45